MLRFWLSRLRRRCGDGATAINEAIVGEDGVAEPAGRRDGRQILIRGGGRGTSSCCGGRCRRGRGSGWAAVRWRTEEGGVSWLEWKGYGGQISNGEKEAMGGGEA